VIRRLLLLIPVLIGVSLIAFFITRAAADPWISYAQGDPSRMTPLQIDLIKEKYHLNDPLYSQYYYWLDSLFHGNLGWSKEAHMFVTDAIAQKFPATFELAMISTIMAVLFGIFLGTKSAVKANSVTDQLSRTMSLVGVSIPVFWLGLILVWVFFAQLHWLPQFGPYNLTNVDLALRYETMNHYTGFLLIDTLLNGDLEFFYDHLLHLILPAITLAFASTAILIRMMRSSMLEVLSSEYVKAARAKGLPENVVIKRHARRNAMIPTTTVIGLTFGGLLGGAVLTETVFQWNGIGQWSAKAAVGVDTPAIMGFTLITALIYVLANLVVDVVYAYLDPRVRLG